MYSGDGEIIRLYVDQDYQQHSIGRRLLATALSEPPIEESERVFLQTWSRAIQARRFYERNGFEFVKEVDGREKTLL